MNTQRKTPRGEGLPNELLSYMNSYEACMNSIQQSFDICTLSEYSWVSYEVHKKHFPRNLSRLIAGFCVVHGFALKTAIKQAYGKHKVSAVLSSRRVTVEKGSSRKEGSGWLTIRVPDNYKRRVWGSLPPSSVTTMGEINE